MARIEGLEKLVARLRAEAAKRIKDSNVSVVVGYTAQYSIYVHENTQANHEVGQAKFLEQPARENRDKYGGIVKQSLQQGRTIAQSLLLAGLALQRDSQELCPIDTGNLRASAFTKLEQGGAT